MDCRRTMIYVWSLMASTIAVTFEILCKLGIPYSRLLPVAVPMALLLNYTVYRMLQLAPNLPSAFIVFSLTNLTARVVASLIMGHNISKGTWAAIVLVAIAAVIRGLWR